MLIQKAITDTFYGIVIYHLHTSSGREYENLIMDCCQLEDGVMGVKREDAAGNDPENGSPDADRGGTVS